MNIPLTPRDFLMTQELNKKKRQTPNSPHYVSNKQFTAAVVAWVNENKGKPRSEWSVIPEYVAECFMKIIDRYALKGNWRGYTYVDEMKAEARLNCIKYAHNFNPKLNNAFAYFTQYVKNSFLQVLQLEKKQANIKYEEINNQSIYSLDRINDLYDEDQETTGNVEDVDDIGEIDEQ